MRRDIWVFDEVCAVVGPCFLHGRESDDRSRRLHYRGGDTFEVQDRDTSSGPFQALRELVHRFRNFQRCAKDRRWTKVLENVHTARRMLSGVRTAGIINYTPLMAALLEQMTVPQTPKESAAPVLRTASRGRGLTPPKPTAYDWGTRASSWPSPRSQTRPPTGRDRDSLAVARQRMTTSPTKGASSSSGNQPAKTGGLAVRSD